MKFNGKKYTSSTDINKGWMKYFKTLYSTNITKLLEKDERELCVIEQQCNASNGKESSLSISLEDISNALRTCKKNKACSSDEIYYEHIIYGGQLSLQVLRNMFSAMAKFAHCPIEMKRGIITTLYKVGNKDKSDPNSYRAISLCSTILKLYDKVIIRHVNFDNTLSPLQGGFQKNLSCSLTSFMIREAIYSATENHCKLFTCYLDVKQAFDNVNHKILLIKLYKTGIDISVFKIIKNLLTDIYSCVRSDGITSDWFQILKGARQGQILSASLYLVYINDIMNDLNACSDSYKLCDTNFGCPTVADDMMLMSYTKSGLQRLMTKCYINSLQNDYTYNSSKSKVVVYNETDADYRQQKRIWALGPDSVDESSQFNHLGI